VTEIQLAQRKPFHLKPWMEIIGILHSFEENNHCIHLEIGNSQLSFPQGSDEAAFLLRKFHSSYIGRVVSILRTDLPEKPILLQLVATRS